VLLHSFFELISWWRPDRFTSRTLNVPRKAPSLDTHLIAAWVDPRTGLLIREKYLVSSYN
jgi:hypothetical protein